jgi:hypothetical protein
MTTAMTCAAIAFIDTRTDGHMTITGREPGALSVIAMISTVARTEMIAVASDAIE